jgi:hypothetical protein
MAADTGDDSVRRAPNTENWPEKDAHDDLSTAGEAAADGARNWGANRVRARIVAGSLILTCMGLVGLFVLIVMGVDNERLLVWQATLGSIMPLAAAATAYYFSRPNEDSPSSAKPR